MARGVSWACVCALAGVVAVGSAWARERFQAEPQTQPAQSESVGEAGRRFGREAAEWGGVLRGLLKGSARPPDFPAEVLEAARRRVQEDCLGAPRPAGNRIENTLGIPFRWCPAGEFEMGEARSKGNSPHRVLLTAGFWLAEHELTEAEWMAVMGGEGAPTRFPKTRLSWEDAAEYCRRLTVQERASGDLGMGWEYALPTEAQWEYAFRAGGAATVSGSASDAWLRENSGGVLHSVGEKQPNAWGLCDMLGNASEWCFDWYEEDISTPAVDPSGPLAPASADRFPASGVFSLLRARLGGRAAPARVIRGGDYRSTEQKERSAANPASFGDATGFRPAMVRSSEKTLALEAAVLEARSRVQEELKTQTTPAGDLGEGALGIPFRWCPPGEFEMGAFGNRSNPARTVVLTQGFWLAEHEVTESEWSALMGGRTGPGTANAKSRVSWEEATAFCQKLTVREFQSGRLKEGWRFALPTEAQWEYACRAGGAAQATNPDAQAWHSRNSGGRLHAAGEKQPNAWGFRDMLGNLWEWCADRYESEPPRHPAVDPRGAVSGVSRSLRGGSFRSGLAVCSALQREKGAPESRSPDIGFRPALIPPPAQP